MDVTRRVHPSQFTVSGSIHNLFSHLQRTGNAWKPLNWEVRPGQQKKRNKHSSIVVPTQ
jgi:hypothetical protein